MPNSEPRCKVCDEFESCCVCEVDLDNDDFVPAEVENDDDDHDPDPPEDFDPEVDDPYDSGSGENNYTAPEGAPLSHREFATDCRKAGFNVRHYVGRNFFGGPAVLIASNYSLQNVIRATSIFVQWDSLGNDIIVYPNS